MGWGKYLGLLGGIGGGLATGAIGKHGINPKYLAMLGGLGGGMALGGAFGDGNKGGGNPNQPQVMPQGAPMPQAMPGQMGAVSSPMQPIQQGAPTGPTFPTGMFGAGADPRQARMEMYRKWQMLNGGGF